LQNLKYLSITIAFLLSTNSFASICTDEMNKFENINQSKKKQICDFFSDSESFREFKSCVFKTIKKFDKTATDSEIYKLSDKDLSGVLSLCAGFSITGETSRKEIKKFNPTAN